MGGAAKGSGTAGLNGSRIGRQDDAACIACESIWNGLVCWCVAVRLFQKKRPAIAAVRNRKSVPAITAIVVLPPWPLPGVEVGGDADCCGAATGVGVGVAVLTALAVLTGPTANVGVGVGVVACCCPCVCMLVGVMVFAVGVGIGRDDGEGVGRGVGEGVGVTGVAKTINVADAVKIGGVPPPLAITPTGPVGLLGMVYAWENAPFASEVTVPSATLVPPFSCCRTRLMLV